MGATLLWTAPLAAQPVAEPERPGEPAPPTAPPPAVAAATEAPDAPQLISVTHVTLAVTDRDATAKALVELSRKIAGTPPGRSGDRVELHVPREQVPAVLDRIRQLGAELHRDTEVRDVSGELADLGSRIASTIATRDRVRTLDASSQSTDDSLLVEHQLDQLDGQLADLKLERARLQSQVDNATIEVALMVDGPAAPEPVPRLQLPFSWLRDLGLGTLKDPTRSEREGEVIDTMLDAGLQAELLYLDGLPDRSDASWAGLGALRFRGRVQGWPASLALGLDAGFGGGNGFVYDLDFLLGMGSSATRWLSFGLLTGAAGRSWNGGRIPAAWEVPAELYVNFQFGDAGRLLLQARPQWIGPRIEDRQDGSSVGFADELVLRGTLALAPLVGHRDMNDGVLRLGVAYHELRDTRLWTFVVGWGAGDTDTVSRR